MTELLVALDLAEGAFAGWTAAQDAESRSRKLLEEARLRWLDAYRKAQKAVEGKFLPNKGLAESYFLYPNWEVK